MKSCLEVVAVHLLQISPSYLGDLVTGVRKQLDGMLLQFVPELNGVPLSYGKFSLELDEEKDGSSAAIIDDNPMIQIPVRVIWTVFSPQPGLSIRGVVNMITEEHLGFLVLDYFSATVIRAHLIGTLQWDQNEETWRDLSGSLVSTGSEFNLSVLDVAYDASMMTISASL